LDSYQTKPAAMPFANQTKECCSAIELQISFKPCSAYIQVMASLAQDQQPRRNKQVVRQLFEATDRKDIERMGQLVSTSNYLFHFPGMPPMDWNTTKQFSTAFTSSFPDLHHEIIDIVAEGDKVAVRLSVTGTHKGELQGIPPTGKKVTFDATDFITLIDGKVSEEWLNADIMGLMQQIGAIPATSHAATGNSSTARS
jgi:predicted ester cyclase